MILCLIFNMVIGIGRSSEIFISKIMKITEVTKNRDENGSRAEFCGSNLHLNVNFILWLHYFSLRL
jgi:hypothetical protein